MHLLFDPTITSSSKALNFQGRRITIDLSAKIQFVSSGFLPTEVFKGAQARTILSSHMRPPNRAETGLRLTEDAVQRWTSRLATDGQSRPSPRQ